MAGTGVRAPGCCRPHILYFVIDIVLNIAVFMYLFSCFRFLFVCFLGA